MTRQRQCQIRKHRSFVWIYLKSRNASHCLRSIPSTSASPRRRTASEMRIAHNSSTTWMTQSTASQPEVVAAAIPETEVFIATTKQQMKMNVMVRQVGRMSPVTSILCPQFSRLHRSVVTSSKYLHCGK